MQVLFVCSANVGRSQMAEAYFSHLSQHDAISAGVNVGEGDGQSLLERSQDPAAPVTVSHVLELMKAEGFDLTAKVRNQVSQEMVEGSDRVISFVPPDSSPDYLSGNPKILYWEVGDPVDMGLEQVRLVKDRIKQQVEDLVREMS